MDDPLPCVPTFPFGGVLLIVTVPFDIRTLSEAKAPKSQKVKA